MALIEWNPSLSVGVSPMDQEHQKLIKIINDLHDAMLKGKSKEVMHPVLKGLVDYTRTHFDHEEKLMSDHQYGNLLTQKKMHQAFVEKLRKILEDYEAGKLSLGMEIMSFLKDWLSGHILGEDKKYGPFFNSRGVN